MTGINCLLTGKFVGLQKPTKMNGEVLAWLSVWNEMQMIGMLSS